QLTPNVVASAVATAQSAPTTTDISDVIGQKRMSLGDAITKFGANAAVAAVNSLFESRGHQARAVDTARVSLLIKVLRTDSDASVRSSAAWALRDVPTAGARDALIQALGHDADAKV